MKSAVKKWLMLLLVCMIASPLLLCLSPVQEAILGKVAAGMGVDAKFEGITIGWSPSPHITMRQLQLVGPRWNATLSSLDIYPDLKFIMSGTPFVKRIEIGTPDVELFMWDMPGQEGGLSGEKGEWVSPVTGLPVAEVQITNGRLGLRTKKRAEEGGHTVSDITASIFMSPKKAEVTLSCRPSFAGSIAGTVQMTPPAAAGEQHLETVWDMDIRARAMDVNRTRESVMALLPGNGVVDQLFSIVTGGSIDDASFRFKGPTSDLGRFDIMEIGIASRNVTIRIPQTTLSLNHVAGSVVIEDSVLKGENLTAAMGNSRLSSGSLTLGIGPARDLFHLDVDLRAELSELPDLMLNIPALEKWSGEIRKITEADGRVSGHLTMGDTYDDIKTNVFITDVRGTVAYSPLDDPIVFRGGAIDVLPDSLSWRGLKGELGPHRIQRSKGKVTWSNGVYVALEGTDALLDTRALYSAFKRCPVLKNHLPVPLLSVAGPVEITGLSFNGHPDRPREMTYSFTVRTDGLKIRTSFLPDELTVNRAAVEVGHAGLRVQRSAAANSPWRATWSM